MWQLASSQSSRKRDISSPGHAPWQSEGPRCVRTAQKKKCLRFQSVTPRRCPCQGFLDNRISTCLLNQETDCHLIQLRLLLPKGGDQSALHALSVSAETKGFGNTSNKVTTCLLSFGGRKKELAMRPILPWNVPMSGGRAQAHAVPRVQLKDRRLPRPLQFA